MMPNKNIKRPRIIGITGSMGSGKSTAAEIMAAEFGAGTLLCDDIGRLAYEEGTETFCRIQALFGTTDRAAISQIVFRDQTALEELNGIIHPFVKAYLRERIGEARAERKLQYLVLESAILFESGLEQMCDEVWYVKADEAVCRERLKQFRGYTKERMDAVLKKQLTKEKYAALADYTLENNSTRKALKAQIEFLLTSH